VTALSSLGPTPIQDASTDPVAAVVEIVLPVFNEAHVLEASVERLCRHLDDAFAFPWHVTIADNASTDATWATARRIAAARPELSAVHLDRKGRGRALKTVWSASPAVALVYMDVDLSTGLDALLPLVAPIVSGHSDVVVGSRRLHGARVRRSLKREVISRAYNLMLTVTLRTRVHDAQCGFKAISRRAAGELLPAIEDDGWFFDTELLARAEQGGLRVVEIPVDWVEDPDSRVDLVHTALADVAGIIRLRRSGVHSRSAVRYPPAVPTLDPRNDQP